MCSFIPNKDERLHRNYLIKVKLDMGSDWYDSVLGESGCEVIFLSHVVYA